MKRILTILILFVCGTASAQVYQRMPQYGYEMQRAKMDSVLQVPGDTIRNKTGVARIGTKLYAGNGTYWTEAGGTTIDTSGIRLRPIAGPGISITGTYPNLTFAGNPDTLTAADPLQLSTVSTKKVRMDFRRAWLDSLLALQVDSSGLLDSALLRGDSLFTYTGGVESYRGKVSGGGGGTLQDSWIADTITNPTINLRDNFMRISGNYGYMQLGGAFPTWISTFGSGGRSVSLATDAIYITNVGSSNTHRLKISTDNSYFIDFYDSSKTKIGIGTYYPSVSLDVAGNSKFRANGTPGTGKVATGTDANGNWTWQTPSGSGVTTTQLTDSLNSREPRYKFRDDSTGNAGYTTLYQNSLKADTFNQTFTGRNTFTSTTSGLIIPRVTTAQMNAISGPTNGEMVYNTDEGATYYYTTDWGWMSDAPEWKRRNGIEQFSEFISQPTAINMQTDFFTTVLANSGTIGSATAVSNRPGIYQLSTSTSANARSSLIADPTNATNILLGGGQLMFETDVQIPTLSNSTETFRFFVGLTSNSQTVSVTSVAFLYDSAGVNAGSGASGNWQVVCANASSRSYTTTTVPVTAGQWYRLKAIVNADRTSVQFYIDGTLVRTETSNIPTTGVTPAVVLTKSNGTTARTALIDWFFLKQKFTTQR